MNAPEPRELTLDVSGHVATITYNRPAKLNAMTPEMARQLAEAVAACNDHASAGTVVPADDATIGIV